MFLIGLTGGLGSGKSTALRVFKRLGARVIDADFLARRAVDPGQPAWRDIKRRFGRQVFYKNGRLNRQRLSRLVFTDKKALKELNAIIHPRVKEMEIRLIAGIKKKRPNAVVVVDAPMMIEAGFHRTKDCLVVMRTTVQNQLKRVVKKGGLSRAQAQARIDAQMPTAKKVKQADYVIENNGTVHECRKQAAAVYREILADHRRSGKKSL